MIPELAVLGLPNIDREEGLHTISQIDAKRYYRMTSVERLKINMIMSFLDYSDEGFIIEDYLRKFSTEDVTYKYRFDNNREILLFKDVTEITEYFSENISKIWYLNRSGKLGGVLEKINDTYVYDKSGEVIDIIHRKVI